MKIALHLFGCAFAFGLLTNCGGTSGNSSAAEAATSKVLLEKTFFPVPENTTPESYQDTVDLQYGGQHVLATVDWTAARRQGCLYIQQIKISRTDSEASVKMSPPSFNSVSCGMQNMGEVGSDADTVRAEIALMEFRGESRNGQASWEQTRTIYANGRVEAPTDIPKANGQ